MKAFLFMTFYCRFFIFPSPSTHLPNRPTPIPPPSILQPPLPSTFLFPISLMVANPSHSPDSLHPEVPPDFHVLKISILILSSTSFPLQLHHCKTPGNLFQSRDFGPSNGSICYGWFGTAYMVLGQINAVKLWIGLTMVTFN